MEWLPGRSRTRSWSEDTLVTGWSTTKGMAAAAAAVVLDTGLFELDQPVCQYWHEFAAGSKTTGRTGGCMADISRISPLSASAAHEQVGRGSAA
ncbi:MAG: serine hydrolase [Acidimicrobiia bacterium]|nr:serine hydrolase [Acidimicrobiia bacterium]